MRVVTRGWKRDCGENSVMSADLEDGYEYAAGRYSPGKLYVATKSNGSIEISKGPTNINLGGAYQTIVSFSKEEIATLFFILHKNQPFAEVIKSLTNVMNLDDEFSPL